MKTKILIALCFALPLCVEVYAEGEQEVKRGFFPYMAFIYYPDESVVDATGARFLRGAILIRPDWLVTTAVGPSIITDGPNGFPRKTLLARLGAVTIDTNFTLNEDEDEQEREIIQIVRPYNHSATQWWRTDISLMQTLLAFNMTSAVSVTQLSPKREYTDKTCIILVYAKKDGNWTEERNLIQLSVELLPPSIQNCGPHFIDHTMTCAADSDENKNTVYDSNFCQGNSGGPLICESNVVGIQTYIDNDCKEPHLYQLLSAWDTFISCGTQDNCHEEHCSQVCDVANKDPPEMNVDIISTAEAQTLSVHTTTPAKPISTTAKIDTTEVEVETTTPSPTPTSTQEETTTEVPTTVSVPESTPQRTVSEAMSEETSETRSWPHEKFTNERKKLEQADNIEMNTDRKPTVEAQQHDVKVKKRSAGQSNVPNTLTTFFGFFILSSIV